VKVIETLKGIIGLVPLIGKERKSVGEWCWLLSALFIVPLLFFYTHFGVFTKIILQFCWAIVAIRAAFLTSESWQQKRKK